MQEAMSSEDLQQKDSRKRVPRSKKACICCTGTVLGVQEDSVEGMEAVRMQKEEENRKNMEHAISSPKCTAFIIGST
jgi:hypothetical protein